MRGRVAATVVLLLLLAGCRHGSAGAASDDEEKKPEPAPIAVEMAVAKVQEVDTRVPAQGTLTPAQGASARIAPLAPGRIRTVNVREGDRVTAGEVVAVLDNRPQEAQVRSAEAALSASEAQAREASLTAAAADTDQRNAVHQAEIALRAAILHRNRSGPHAHNAVNAAPPALQKTRGGARPQEIAQAEAAVSQARATRDRAATEVQRQQLLFDRGISARRQLEDARTALQVADAQLATAQQQLSLLQAGARPEDVRAAEIAVRQAQEALTAARTSGDAKIAQAQAALRQAKQQALSVAAKRQDAAVMQRTAQQKAADLAAARATAGLMELRSPINGIVTRRLLNPNEAADTTTPIVEVADTSRLNLSASLPADQGVQVRRGMEARIRSTEWPGRDFPGRVLDVGQVDPQTNLMTVRIAVQNTGGRLRTGAFATVQMILRRDPYAVVVPNQAVISKEGKPVVFVVTPDNIAHQREVSTGAEQDDVVQILSGVNAGQKVIRLGQYELSDGAKVRPPEAAPEKKDTD